MVFCFVCSRPTTGRRYLVSTTPGHLWAVRTLPTPDLPAKKTELQCERWMHRIKALMFGVCPCKNSLWSRQYGWFFVFLFFGYVYSPAFWRSKSKISHKRVIPKKMPNSKSWAQLGEDSRFGIFLRGARFQRKSPDYGPPIGSPWWHWNSKYSWCHPHQRSPLNAQNASDQHLRPWKNVYVIIWTHKTTPEISLQTSETPQKRV